MYLKREFSITHRLNVYAFTAAVDLWQDMSKPGAITDSCELTWHAPDGDVHYTEPEVYCGAEANRPTPPDHIWIDACKQAIEFSAVVAGMNPEVSEIDPECSGPAWVRVL